MVYTCCIPRALNLKKENKESDTLFSVKLQKLLIKTSFFVIVDALSNRH